MCLPDKHITMAEILVAQKGGRRKVQMPRIDFTPMVDLGFILITFFIYTTTIARPGSLEINMPSRETIGGITVYADTSTITLIAVSNHKVAYYKGVFNEQKPLSYKPVAEVKDMLTAIKKQVADLPLSLSLQAHKLHVIIKPNDNCKYEDVVQLLDDMNLVEVPYYALVDISAEEKQMVDNF